MYCVIGWQESERKKFHSDFFSFFDLIEELILFLFLCFSNFYLFLGEVAFFFVCYNFLILFYKRHQP